MPIFSIFFFLTFNYYYFTSYKKKKTVIITNIQFYLISLWTDSEKIIYFFFQTYNPFCNIFLSFPEKSQQLLLEISINNNKIITNKLQLQQIKKKKRKKKRNKTCYSFQLISYKFFFPLFNQIFKTVKFFRLSLADKLVNRQVSNCVNIIKTADMVI